MTFDISDKERTEVGEGFREFSKWFAQLAELAEAGKDDEAGPLMVDIFAAMHSLELEAYDEAEFPAPSAASQRLAKIFFPEGDDPDNISGAMNQMRKWGNAFLSVPLLHEEGKTEAAAMLAVRTVRQVYIVLHRAVEGIETMFPGTKVYVEAHDDCKYDDLHAHGGLFAEEAPTV